MPGTNKTRRMEILLVKLINFAQRNLSYENFCEAKILFFVLQLNAVLGAVLDVLGIELAAHRAELGALGRNRRGLLLRLTGVLFHGVADQSAAERAKTRPNGRAGTGMVRLLTDDRASSSAQETPKHRTLGRF